jgi:hypothetical protein
MPVGGSIVLRVFVFGSIVAGAWLCTPLARAITIDIRVMCEVSGGCGAGDFFFDHPEAFTALEFAARAFEPFRDSLLAIPASPGWTATFTNPDTGAPGYSLPNLAIPADTLVLYAGGRDFDANNPTAANQVAEAGPGRANISLSRGQGTITGPAAHDFSTWGGSIAFDTLANDVPRNWHFGISTPPGPGQVDFLTIAFHELAHVFGFGTASSFDNLITNNQFQGATVIGLTGSTVALAADNNHWEIGTTSPPYADESASALTAALLLGRRTPFTPLDYAALADTGWEVPAKLLGLHGDANQDGNVDGRDFLAWQRGYDAAGVSVGDMTGDLIVDEFDLWLWRNNYGAQLAAEPQVALRGIAANIQVPEPCGLALCCSTVFLLMPRSFQRGVPLLTSRRR